VISEKSPVYIVFVPRCAAGLPILLPYVCTWAIIFSTTNVLWFLLFCLKCVLQNISLVTKSFFHNTWMYKQPQAAMINCNHRRLLALASEVPTHMTHSQHDNDVSCSRTAIYDARNKHYTNALIYKVVWNLKVRKWQRLKWEKILWNIFRIVIFALLKCENVKMFTSNSWKNAKTFCILDLNNAKCKTAKCRSYKCSFVTQVTVSKLLCNL